MQVGIVIEVNGLKIVVEGTASEDLEKAIDTQDEDAIVEYFKSLEICKISSGNVYPKHWKPGYANYRVGRENECLAR